MSKSLDSDTLKSTREKNVDNLKIGVVQAVTGRREMAGESPTNERTSRAIKRIVEDPRTSMRARK